MKYLIRFNQVFANEVDALEAKAELDQLYPKMPAISVVPEPGRETQTINEISDIMGETLLNIRTMIKTSEDSQELERLCRAYWDLLRVWESQVEDHLGEQFLFPHSLIK